MKQITLFTAFFLPLLAACDGGGTAGTGVVTIASDNEAAVCGTVTDPTGAPMSQVTVATTTERDAAKTDSDGTFILNVSGGGDGAEIIVVDHDGAVSDTATIDVQSCDEMSQLQ